MHKLTTKNTAHQVTLTKLLAVYIMSIIFAAIVTPIFWTIITHISAVFNSTTCDYIINKGFAKTFDRVRMIPLFFMVIWLIKASGIKKLSDLLIKFDANGVLLFLTAFIVGMTIILALKSLHLLVGAVTFDGGNVVLLLTRALISALLIATAEEIIFRNLLQNMFCERFGKILGVICISLIFAYLHSKIPNKISISSNTIIASVECSFWMIFGVFANFNLINFLNLFLLGCVLSVLVIQTKSLMASIGFHAGIVTIMLTSHFLFTFEKVSNAIINGSKVINSVSATFILAILMLAILFKNSSVKD